ncbi:MerR family transcriptional regulator [Actinopolymorpha alba]|uniref:MerR family transcriptional regulator n=1 Tax=Actinopolymorpha alba TaxID=533267 RepID=UPI000477CEE2|nr:MerR family transcriptional regulator [Actinopolymorpha alba]
MRIGELARLTGVSVRSLRYYEEQSLLRPERHPNGYRSFSESDVERVAQIQLLFASGLNSRCIADLLPCMCGSGTDEFTTPAPYLVDGLLPVRERIVAQITALTASLQTLDRVIAAARGPSPQG